LIDHRCDNRSRNHRSFNLHMTALPQVPEAFYWTHEPWGPALRCRRLERVAPHVFTSRQLTLSGRPEGEAIGELLDVGRVAMLTQIHGNAVVAVRSDARPADAAPRPDADALVSDDPGVAVAVRAADCVPLLMADMKRGVVAAVHAGWRGTAAGVAVAAVNALAREFGTAPRDLVVAVGPAIGPCCYEVGSDLVDAFAAAGHERHRIDRWFVSPPPPRGSRDRQALRLDLPGANRDQLILAGVVEENIHDVGLCTAMHLDVLTSYRAEKEQAVRLIAAIRAANEPG
jgi:YfiH family protein